MDKNKSFMFRREWYEIITDVYESEDANLLISAIVKYGIFNVKTYPLTEIMFLDAVYAQIDSDLEEYRKRCESNG